MKNVFFSLFSSPESTEDRLKEFVGIEKRLIKYSSSSSESLPSTPSSPAASTPRSIILTKPDSKAYITAFSTLINKLNKDFAEVPVTEKLESPNDVEKSKIIFLYTLSNREVIENLNATTKLSIQNDVWACFKEFLQDEVIVDLLRSVGSVKVDEIQNGNPNLAHGDPKKFEALITFRSLAEIYQLIAQITALKEPNAHIKTPKDVQIACAEFYEKISTPDNTASAKHKI